jgi:hypothetical protein
MLHGKQWEMEGDGCSESPKWRKSGFRFSAFPLALFVIPHPIVSSRLNTPASPSLGGLKVARNMLPWQSSVLGNRKRHVAEARMAHRRSGAFSFGGQSLRQSVVQ